MEDLFLCGTELSSGNQLLTFGEGPLTLAAAMRSLGVLLETSLSMEAQVPIVAILAFYHFWLVRQLVSYLSSCDLATVIHAGFTCSFDYYNLLYGAYP